MGELMKGANKSLQDELIPVLEAGVCVGCGVCAAYSPDSVRMSRDDNGAMVAELCSSSHAKKASGGVCPFGDDAPDEEPTTTVVSTATVEDAEIVEDVAEEGAPDMLEDAKSGLGKFF